MLRSHHGCGTRLFLLATTLGMAATVAAGCAVGPDPAGPTGEVSAAALAAWPAPHLAQAQLYIAQIAAGDQINNHYGSPASITYDASGVLHATTMCSTFLTLCLLYTSPSPRDS